VFRYRRLHFITLFASKVSVGRLLYHIIVIRSCDFGMAHIIKQIATFSEDAVHTAIEQTITDADKKSTFTGMLEHIHSHLQRPPKRPKKEMKMFRISDKEIFEKKIIPQIREKLAEYDRLETSGKGLEWKVCFDFLGDDYKTLNMVQLKSRHSKILEQEVTLASLDLVAKYYRGLVYVRARALIETDQHMKTMFRREFGICYETARRYITFAALIKRYPRLMVCGLSYAQIAKHQMRLFNFLKTDAEGLHDKLSQPFHASTEGIDVEIQPADINVPEVKYNTDPDYVYEDFFNDTDCDEIPDDEDFTKWLQETEAEFFKRETFSEEEADELSYQFAQHASI